ncbi:hypothetical protein GFS03_07790 [Sulfolobus sp. E5-1-F]|nr:hypothetical protein GFS03_07790 [Sulfolobus sp. E5-1-F]QGA69687.1 hypothetical protein GFS33_13215 [Sulfolobus sp. E11-6]
MNNAIKKTYLGSLTKVVE